MAPKTELRLPILDTLRYTLRWREFRGEYCVVTGAPILRQYIQWLRNLAEIMEMAELFRREVGTTGVILVILMAALLMGHFTLENVRYEYLERNNIPQGPLVHGVGMGVASRRAGFRAALVVLAAHAMVVEVQRELKTNNRREGRYPKYPSIPNAYVYIYIYKTRTPRIGSKNRPRLLASQ